MGILEYFLLTVILVVLAYLAIWVIDHLAPGHPSIINTIIWVVVVVVLALILIQAMGLLGFDPQIPRLRR